MKTKSDPTGQSKARRRAYKALSNRLTRAERRVKALFRSIPRKRRSEAVITNDSEVFYDYDLSAFEQEQLRKEIEAILDQEVLETEQDSIPPFWWWEQYVEQPYRQGTLDEIVTFNQLVGGAIAAKVLIDGFPPRKLEGQQVVTSTRYADDLNKVYTSNFAAVKAVSDRTSDQVIQQINLGIQAGNKPSVIASTISKRFDISRSSAMRTAVTEVNKAYNDAKMNANLLSAEQTGLRSAVMHISALLPTTRKTHAARHGNVYTVRQQTEWWNDGANRINCHCTVRPVLIDGSGKIIDVELQEEIKAERSFFDIDG
jgi:SPP1 gp7 family putative phage head morphogenesis protein